VIQVIDGLGTDEASWRPWLASRRWPSFDLADFTGRRVVVLAAHPDDEVLGAGGLLRRLADREVEIDCVWATDGEASHPTSTAITPEQLGVLRRAESIAALQRLRVPARRVVHLGLPDSGLADRVADLVAELLQVIGDDDLVLAPWRGDGHPDHEAVGTAAAAVTAHLIEYPIWMWHWALPDDPRVPWQRARAVSDIDVAAKAQAIDVFETQVRPIGPGPDDAPILPPNVLARFLRPDEVVFQ
jgi:LmbE family N-acetylglucosaminyl deacetylase